MSRTSTPWSTVVTVSNADTMRFCIITSRSLIPLRNLATTEIIYCYQQSKLCQSALIGHTRLTSTFPHSAQSLSLTLYNNLIYTYIYTIHFHTMSTQLQCSPFSGTTSTLPGTAAYMCSSALPSFQWFSSFTPWFHSHVNYTLLSVI